MPGAATPPRPRPRLGRAPPRRRAASPLAAAALLAFAVSAAAAAAAAAADADAAGAAGASAAADCPALLRSFRDLAASSAASPYDSDFKLLFFLHIPRTAGRSLFTCLLRPGTHPAARCPKSYESLDPGQLPPDCRLLSSHDDYSVVAQLPPGRVAVVTQLRDPLQRFVSAYEFAIEAAAKEASMPPAVAEEARRRRQRQRTARPAPDGGGGGGGGGGSDSDSDSGSEAGDGPDPRRTHTINVWPWSHLIPFFTADIRQRAAALEAAAAAAPPVDAWAETFDQRGKRSWFNAATDETRDEPPAGAVRLPPLDPYDNPAVMPLAEFAAHPIAAELLHDSQALQILGLTNYSQWAGAEGLRRCIGGDGGLRRELTDFAASRLRSFAHVGALERIRESVEAAAAALRMPLDGAAHVPAAQAEGGGEQEGGGEAPSLAGHFHRCTARASRRSAARRAHALSRLGLPDGRRVEFGKGARRGIPPEVLEDIRRRSPMDAELYDLALQLLDDSRSRAAEAGTLLRLPDAPPQKPPPLQQHQRGGGGATGQGQGGEAERPRRRRPARQQQEGGAPPVRDELRR